jgi:hypothetical protein
MKRVKLTINKVVCYAKQAQTYWLSEKEHKADALALGADEGRGKLR